MIFVVQRASTASRCQACDGHLEPMTVITLTPVEAEFGLSIRLCNACRETLASLLWKPEWPSTGNTEGGLTDL